MQATQLWSHWQDLLSPCAAAFTAPGWRRFLEWTTGLVLNVEEHTVTQSLVGLDRPQDWKTLESFVEYGAWDRDTLERVTAALLDHAPGRLWYGYRVWAGDDTKVHRNSANVWGTCTFHEYTARCPNRASTVPDNEPGRTGDEGPQHEVTLTRPFYLGVYPVTVGQFREFVKDAKYQTEAEKGGGATRRFPDGKWANDPSASWLNPGFEQTDDHPVVCVSWNDAQAFCGWLSKKEGKQCALPTEAQWEYSCRAGSFTKYFCGNSDSVAGDYFWHGGNSGSKTHPVGTKKPNAWGLYDMGGNVRNWCQDIYDKGYYKVSPKEDPAGPSAGGARVLRGGRWHGGLTYCRSASRYSGALSDRNDSHGFRVVVFPASLGRVHP